MERSPVSKREELKIAREQVKGIEQIIKDSKKEIKDAIAHKERLTNIRLMKEKAYLEAKDAEDRAEAAIEKLKKSIALTERMLEASKMNEADANDLALKEATAEAAAFKASPDFRASTASPGTPRLSSRSLKPSPADSRSSSRSRLATPSPGTPRLSSRSIVASAASKEERVPMAMADLTSSLGASQLVDIPARSMSPRGPVKSSKKHP